MHGFPRPKYQFVSPVDLNWRVLSPVAGPTTEIWYNTTSSHQWKASFQYNVEGWNVITLFQFHHRNTHTTIRQDYNRHKWPKANG